jgi:hypothetical protein
MRKSRPIFALVLAFAQMLVGGFLIFVGAINFASAAAGTSSARVTVNQGGKPATRDYDTRDEMERESPGYKLVYVASGIAGFLLAFMMISGGIGLVSGRSWGWWLSLAWAVLAFLFQAGMAGYLWFVAMPAANRVVKVVPHDDARVCSTLVNNNTFFHLGWALFATAFLFYPLLVSFLLTLPSIRRWCRPVVAKEDEVSDDDR